jgi:hypothetical protein
LEYLIHQNNNLAAPMLVIISSERNNIIVTGMLQKIFPQIRVHMNQILNPIKGIYQMQKQKRKKKDQQVAQIP